jgi:hypothetical protein
MADGSTRNRNADLFTTLARPKVIANLGKVAGYKVFSRRILPNNKGLTIRNMAIKVANSPVIIPSLFSHFTAAVEQMAQDHAMDQRFSYVYSRATMYVSQEYLEPGETNLFGDYHIDAFNIADTLNGREAAQNIYLVSNVEHLTACFYVRPLTFNSQEEAKIKEARPSHQLTYLNDMLESKLYNSPFIKSRPLYLYRFGIFDPHSVPDADTPIWRTVLSVHFETDHPIPSVKARAKTRPFLFNHNPALADWITRHAARPADYGL